MHASTQASYSDELAFHGYQVVLLNDSDCHRLKRITSGKVVVVTGNNDNQYLDRSVSRSDRARSIIKNRLTQAHAKTEKCFAPCMDDNCRMSLHSDERQTIPTRSPQAFEMRSSLGLLTATSCPN